MSRLYNILNKLAGNAVVEQGTSGGWTYKKYADGTAECWGNHTRSIAVNIASSAYGGYRSDAQTFDFPFSFTSVPSVSIIGGSGSNGAWINSALGTGPNGAVVLLSSATSQTATNRTIHIHAYGNWK